MLRLSNCDTSYVQNQSTYSSPPLVLLLTLRLDDPSGDIWVECSNTAGDVLYGETLFSSKTELNRLGSMIEDQFHDQPVLLVSPNGELLSELAGSFLQDILPGEESKS